MSIHFHLLFFFNDTATTEIYTLSLHDALPICFVHAQDRLFQMDTMRRYGAGRLSEWFGPTTLRADRFTRTLGLYRAAERQYALLTPELRAALDAYAAAVNAYLAHHQPFLPPQYHLLRPTP